MLILCVIAVLFALPAAAAAPPAGSLDEASASAVLEQEVLPDLAAREATARARREARDAPMDVGGASAAEVFAVFVRAYPRLRPEALGQPEVLRSRLATLDESAVLRAQEQEAIPQTVRSAGHDASQRWREVLAAVHEAEQAADAAERSLLVGVLARLRSHPELTTEGAAWLGDAVVGVVPGQRTLAEVDADRAALEGTLLGLRLGVLPDAASVADDLASLAGPYRAPAAEDRLFLRLPWLQADVASRVRAALEEHLASSALPHAGARVAAANEALGTPSETPRALEAVQADEVLARARQEAAEVRVRALGSPVDALSEARFEVAQARKEAASAELSVLVSRRRELQGQAAPASEASDEARNRADLAQAEAEAALKRASDPEDLRLADALRGLAEARERLAEREEATATTTLRMAEHQTYLTTLVTLEREVARIAATSTFALATPDGLDPDAVYARLRSLLGDLRGEGALRGDLRLSAREATAASERVAAADRAWIDEDRALIFSLEPEAREAHEAVLDEWEAVLADELRAALAWETHTDEELDLLLGALQRARVAKRSLMGRVSVEVRQADASYLIEDTREELEHVVPSFWSLVRRRALDAENAPQHLKDWNVVRTLLSGSLWTILSGLLWWWARRRAGSWALSLSSRVRQLWPELRLADVRALRDPVARAIRNTVDLSLGPLLLWSLGDGLPELQLLVRLYLYLATYRALLAVFDLAVVPSDQMRPSLMAVRPSTYRLARRTVRLFLGFFVVYRLMDFVLWSVLGLDTLSSWVSTVLQGLLVVGVVALLFRWEPVLRGRLARRSPSSNPLVRWLLREDGSVLLRIPRALGHLVLFGAIVVSDLSHRFAHEGTSLAWVVNVLNRYRLQDADPDTLRPLPESMVERIVSGEMPERHLVEREELSEVVAAVDAWRQSGRRGLVAVVGDRGTGKGTSCDVLAQRLDAVGLEVSRAVMDRSVRTDAALFAFVGRAVGVDGRLDRPEELVERLRSVPPKAVILEEIHRCFARKVGGLNQVQALLYVLNAASDHHFFVVSVHGPTWDYFSSTGSMVDCGVFHTVARLAPFGSQQLRAITMARAGMAGLKVDFDTLTRETALGGDAELERDRTVDVFYRLLAEASNGSPTVAVDLFARCLQLTDDPVRVQPVMGQALSLDTLPGLSDDSLFVLVALNLHDALGEADLVEVTNVPTPVVRATVRDLVSRGLVSRQDGHLHVTPGNRSVVQRTLRRRHFLHLGPG
ncbi:MAG: hypothetical protein KTR31_15175 [Myxococcales bacterium]|nr:hypothetical protein [Myxococcales bacterium]